MFLWSETSRPIVALAPMAGVTDASFRQLVKRLAPEAIVFTEFLSSDAIAFGAKRTMKMLEFDPAIEKPFIVQIFGADPKKFLDSCKIIEQMGADGIDINMGCPAAKIVSSCYGSALIRNPDLAADIVHAATNAVSIPVSVKTRLGWESADALIPFCKKLEAAGAKALSIHGRTYKGKFAGAADWEPIYALKKEVGIPVLGNGDVKSAEDALSKIQNLDGVMVGRATFGNPWVMREITDALQRGMLASAEPKAKPGLPAMASEVDHKSIFRERLPFILEHCEISVRMKGERRGVLEMRRHLSSYVKGFDGAKELRMTILTLEKLSDVKRALASA